MFKPNTLIVVGAGASYELGFPIGVGLKSEISSVLHSDVRFLHSPREEPSSTFAANYRAIYGETGEVSGFTLRGAPHFQERMSVWAQIRHGINFSGSIDNFLHMRRGEPELIKTAKAAICKIIAGYESKLPVPENDLRNFNADRWLNSPERVKDVSQPTAWTQHCSEILFSGAKLSDVSDALKRVSVISFNYDRCVEQFIAIAIQSIYNTDIKTAKELASKLDVVHPYGSLGEMWDALPQNRVAFGQVPPNIHEGGGIRTFTEGPEDSEIRSRISKMMEQSDQVIVLGFAYHKQNLQLLGLAPKRQVRVLGTSLGLSATSTADAVDFFRRGFDLGTTSPSGTSATIDFKPITCAELLSQEAVALTE